MRLHVLRHRPIAGDAAHPVCQVCMWRVDQAGDHDHFGRIDHLRVGGRLDRGRDRGDVVVLHQHVAAEIARLQSMETIGRP